MGKEQEVQVQRKDLSGLCESARASRSLTRSPTPIKYNYDIYKKRSPTFGRRCPVLNRRPRAPKSDTNNRSKSTNRQQDQVTLIQTSSTGNSNRDRKARNYDDSDTSDAIKPVSSRISSGTSKGRSVVWDNPSYFQHDDRESQQGGKKVSRKRKPRQSPYRWQHDLFEDDGSPLEKVGSSLNQSKEAKISVSDD